MNRLYILAALGLTSSVNADYKTGWYAGDCLRVDEFDTKYGGVLFDCGSECYETFELEELASEERGEADCDGEETCIKAMKFCEGDNICTTRVYDCLAEKEEVEAEPVVAPVYGEYGYGYSTYGNYGDYGTDEADSEKEACFLAAVCYGVDD
jgi:hypothetical protein